MGALSSISTKDKDGNTFRGDTFTIDTKNTFIRSECRLVAAIGIKDFIVVDTPDALLISDKKNTQDVKKIISYIRSKKRTEHERHKKVFRPWGTMKVLLSLITFKSKASLLNRGQSFPCKCIQKELSIGLLLVA